MLDGMALSTTARARDVGNGRNYLVGRWIAIDPGARAERMIFRPRPRVSRPHGPC
jgi:hypothetical protein